MTTCVVIHGRYYRGLEQSMVALERINEYSILTREAPEYVEPRPPASWPEQGKLEIDKLVIRYAVRRLFALICVVGV